MTAIPPLTTSPMSAASVDPLEPTALPPVILADKIDDATGDFESLTQGRDPTDAAVQVTFTTQRQTGAAAQKHGHRFLSLKHADELDEAAIEGLSVEAAKHLLDARDIRLERVRGGIESPGTEDTGEATIEFRNLRTGKVVTRKIPADA